MSTQHYLKQSFGRISGEALWIILGQVIMVAGSLVGVRLLTGSLEPEVYGEFALGLTIVALINQLVLGPLSNGATRFYSLAVERSDISNYLKAVKQLVIKSAIFILLVTICGLLILLLFVKTKFLVFGFACVIFALISGINSVLNGVQNAARQRSIVALHQGLATWTQYFFAVVFVICLGHNSENVMLGFILSSLLILFSQLYFFKHTISSGSVNQLVSSNWGKEIVDYSWPFAAWGIFTWAQIASDRWALSAFSPMRELGLYAVLFQLGYAPVSLATNMLVQLLAPIYFQRAGKVSDIVKIEKVNKLNLKLTIISLAFTFIMFGAVLALHKQIFAIFVAPEYRVNSYLLPWLALAAGFFATGQITSINLMSQLRTKTMLAVKITTASLGLGLNFLGSYFYGIKGVVFGVLAFSFVYLMWMFLLTRTRMNNASTIVGETYLTQGS